MNAGEMKQVLQTVPDDVPILLRWNVGGYVELDIRPGHAQHHPDQSQQWSQPYLLGVATVPVLVATPLTPWLTPLVPATEAEVERLPQTETSNKGEGKPMQGKVVRLLMPDNRQLDGTLAVVVRETPWGAILDCASAAAGQVRALHSEMVPVQEAQPCDVCGALALRRTGTCLTCEVCGTSTGC